MRKRSDSEVEGEDTVGELISFRPSHDSELKTLSEDDLLNQLEEHYANVDEEVSDHSELSDGLDEDIDTYVKIIEDSEDNERKSKYKGKPQFSEELSSYFSALSESERAKMILDLATESVNEKIETSQHLREGTSSSMIHSNKMNAMDSLPPEDTNMIYKNANSQYSGLYSDDARIMEQSTHYNADQQTTWNEIEGDEDLDTEAYQELINVTQMDTAKNLKKKVKSQRRRMQLDENDQQESGSGAQGVPEEFNATATQMVMKRNK